MSKKVIALMVALMMLLSLSACGAEEQDTASQSAAEPAAETQSAAQGSETSATSTEPAGTGRAPRVTPLGNGEDQVTVMVYLCGSDLESDGGAATADISRASRNANAAVPIALSL